MTPAAPPPVEAAFRGDPGSRVLTFTHPPARPSGAGVVICSPIGAEHVQNQPRELELARALAARGLLVRRFHFRGTGDSDGQGLTFDSMSEDSAAAARQLLDSGEVSRVAFVGTRLAAMLLQHRDQFEGTTVLADNRLVTDLTDISNVFLPFVSFEGRLDLRMNFNPLSKSSVFLPRLTRL